MQYPTEIFTYVANKTFCISQEFTYRGDVATAESPFDKPMEIFDDNFSRFVLTGIANGKSAYMNLPVDMLAGIEAATGYAFNKAMDMKSSTAVSGPASPAYTVRFFSGSLKGKTPAEVLAENGAAGRDILNKQYKWLKDNLSKFPNNKKLMDAISDAAKIENIEQAPKASVAPVTILKIDQRPLVRKKREDGKVFCYEGMVSWNFDMNYPVSIRIANYYAPVTKNDKGLYNVQLSQKDAATENVIEIKMMPEKWLAAIEAMRFAKDEFKHIYYKTALTTAINESKKNRQEAAQKKAEAAPGFANQPVAVPSPQSFVQNIPADYQIAG